MYQVSETGLDMRLIKALELAAQMQAAARNAPAVIVSSNPGFIEAYRNACAMSRIARAKQRVAAWFARATEAGVVVDLGVVR